MKNAIALNLYFLKGGLVAGGDSLPIRGKIRDRALVHGSVDAESSYASAHAILDGRHSPDLSVARLLREGIPSDWAEQQRRFGHGSASL